MASRPPLLALVAALAAVCLLIPSSVRLRGDTPVFQIDTAYVNEDDGGTGWTIGNEFIRYSLGRDGGSVGVRQIADAVSGLDWNRSNDPDSFVTLNGQRVNIGSSATQFLGANESEWWGGARLDLTYRVTSAPIEIMRSYVCYPGSSVIETWTTYHPAGLKAVTLSDLTNYALTVNNGTLRWIGGLDVDDTAGGPFNISSGAIDDGQTFEIGADKRSSETNLPFFALRSVDSQDAQFFGSILWSGQWRLRIRRQGDQVVLQLGLPTFNTTVGAGGSLEGPHAIFGTTNRVLPDVSMAIRSFIDKGVRHGRPLRALTTYNTWFSYGTFVDEASMQSEMNLAASIGVEQFVLDAGWWAGIDPDDPSDFSKSWGNWTVDPDRFPSGLGALTDYAHQLGMRFGIWVEPERVDRNTVPEFAQERFLATQDGRYDPGQPNSVVGSAQICLADAEARNWLLSKLYALLDDAHPDYLKWDNNFWVNCNRPIHGHGTEDGNFQHFRQLENVFGALRDRYPDMDIENCSNGGHRLSLEMLGYTDVGWVDDQSSPSRRVRHNLEGLTALFPPGYLLTFAMGDANEAFDASNQADLRLLMRSRMAAVLGGTWSGRDMGEDTLAAIGEQNALYKIIRPVIQEGSTILPILQDGRAIFMDRQVTLFPDLPWSGWDAVEHVAPRTGDVVILAFDTPDGPDSIIVKPRALRDDALYDVTSADFGDLGSVTGRELMSRGIQLDVSGITHSHALLLKIHRDQ